MNADSGNIDSAVSEDQPGSVLLSLEGVDKFYGKIDDSVHAVRNVSMQVRRGEIIALLGSSGCGKTSTLRMVAGFEAVSRGIIRLADREIHTLAPVKRNVAMAFEGYSLYPPLTIRENIGFALKSSSHSAFEISRRVDEVAGMLEIDDIMDRYPSSVSGGQQQRASLARALVRDADLHLLDEPMGQLEPQLRTLLRGRIKHFIKIRGLTAILVTHDQTEANALADRIAVMEDGCLQQFDTPQHIKRRPANLFTGTFVGEPPMNVFPASISVANGQLRFSLPEEVFLDYAQDRFTPALRDAMLKRHQVMVGVRPYAVRRTATGAPARVMANQWLGDQSHLAARFAGGTIVLVEHDRAEIGVGESLQVSIEPEELHLFDPATGKAISHGVELVTEAGPGMARQQTPSA